MDGEAPQTNSVYLHKHASNLHVWLVWYLWAVTVLNEDLIVPVTTDEIKVNRQENYTSL